MCRNEAQLAKAQARKARLKGAGPVACLLNSNPLRKGWRRGRDLSLLNVSRYLLIP
jgi:hypothetical protein